jgi:hypothetical protein
MQTYAAPALPRLYSATVIRVFATLFSAVAGGLMLAQNLRDLGQPAAARRALRGSIIFTSALFLISTLMPNMTSINSIGIVMGMVGGMAKGSYYEQRVPEHADYPRKSITKPLLLCLLVCAVLLALQLPEWL